MNKVDFRQKTVLAVIALSIAGSAIYQLPYIKDTFYDPFLQVFDMSNRQAGFLLTVYAIGCMITYIPGGIIADRFRPKKLLLLSLFGTSLLAIILAFSMNYRTAVIIWFLLALSTTFLFWATIMKALRILGGRDQSGEAYGWYYALSSLLSFASIAVEVYVYDIFQSDSSKAIFWVIMIIGIANAISGLLVWVFFKDDDVSPAGTAAEDRLVLKDLPAVLKNPYVWASSTIMFCTWSVNGGLSYFTPYMTSQIGMEVTESAFLANVRMYLLLLLCPLGGYIADKILKSTLKFYAIGFVILIGLFCCVIFIPLGPGNMATAIALSMITSAVILMMYGIMWSILNEVDIPVKYAATAVGIASLITYLPDLFLYTLFGNWLDVYGDAGGYLRIFIALGITAGIAFLLSILLALRVKNRNLQKKFREETE